MDIEFKEKTFEKYFGHELARLTNITYSPDQCDESILGFDEAFYLPLTWFSGVGPYVRRRRRGRLTGIAIDRFNEIGKLAARDLPPFRLNLFVQFKRPKFLTSNGAREWPDWKQSYYRYDITPHQQEALERIEAQSYGRAATIYASPAFWQGKELYDYMTNSTVIEHSNMASALKLKGHEHYSYISSGYIGKGHSETVEIENEPLRKIIENGSEINEPLPLIQHLKKVAASIIEATKGSDLVTPIFDRVRTAMGFEEINLDSLYDAIGIIEAFSEAFDLRYYAISES